MGPEDNPVDDMPADKLEYELWEREHAAKDRQYPKCRHCSGENHYGQKYDGYCFDCHNHGVIDLIDERDAAIQRADRAEAERDAATAERDRRAADFTPENANELSDVLRCFRSGVACIVSARELVGLYERATAEVGRLRAELDTERECRRAAEKAIAAVPAMCRGELVAGPLHLSSPICELLAERDAAVQRTDRAEAERDATENTVLSMQETNVAFSRAIDEVDRLRADVTALIPAARAWMWSGVGLDAKQEAATRAVLDRHAPPAG